MWAWEARRGRRRRTWVGDDEEARHIKFLLHLLYTHEATSLAETIYVCQYCLIFHATKALLCRATGFCALLREEPINGTDKWIKRQQFVSDSELEWSKHLWLFSPISLSSEKKKYKIFWVCLFLTRLTSFLSTFRFGSRQDNRRNTQKAIGYPFAFIYCIRIKYQVNLNEGLLESLGWSREDLR